MTKLSVSSRGVGLLFDCAPMVGSLLRATACRNARVAQKNQPWIAETIATLGFSAGLTLWPNAGNYSLQRFVSAGFRRYRIGISVYCVCMDGVGVFNCLVSNTPSDILVAFRFGN
jgi:hypothetical protein